MYITQISASYPEINKIDGAPCFLEPVDEMFHWYKSHTIKPDELFNLRIPDEILTIGNDRIMAALENSDMVAFEIKTTKHVVISKNKL